MSLINLSSVYSGDNGDNIRSDKLIERFFLRPLPSHAQYRKILLHSNFVIL